MSQSVTLLCPTNVTLRDISVLCTKRFPGQVREATLITGEIVQITPADHHYVSVSQSHREEEAAAEYDDNEDLDPEFRSIVWDRNYFRIHFNDFELVRAVLLTLVGAQYDPSACWLDTDYGWVIRGDRFLQLAQADSDWDWRHAPS
jgi:hypothetical protein